MPPSVPILIPAYQPGEMLARVTGELARLSENPIVVVDDGSGPEFAEVFRGIEASGRVHVVHHAVNLGKGAALKTGLNYALVHFPNAAGVVTADADGQHHPEDILRIAARLDKQPGALVMGVRGFAGDVPLRSRIGNGLTRVLMRLLIGQRLTDTQTGLRGVPASLIPHLLKLPSSGYEFTRNSWLEAEKALHAAFTIIRVTVLDQVQDGDKVATRWAVTAQQTGEFFGVPSKGRTATLTGTTFDRIVDGKLAEHWAEVGVPQFLQQLAA